MPGKNITQAEAALRSTQLKVDSYNVHIDLTSGDETFIATTTVKFEGLQVGATTFIDACGKAVISATLNGQTFDPKYDGESVFLPPLAATNELVLVVEGNYSKTGEGLHRFVDPADNEIYLYTQFETGDARRMFACFDQPDLKATFTLSAITPEHWAVISNDPVVKEVALGGGKKETHFGTTPVVPTYITAIVAGPYTKVEDTYVGKKTIPLGIYCRKSLAQHLDPEDIFLLTKQGFAYFEEVFGLAYPFAKYDQIAVAEFNWGAMENAGCITFAEDVLVFRSKVTERAYVGRATTILHEMAHMWFGDLVTMKWWNDLWLNESFAEWASYDAAINGTRFTGAATEFNSIRKNWGYRADQLSSTHPIAVEMADLDSIRVNFDGISYAKGASVLQQLVAHVGRENFIKGLQAYFAKHAWKNTVLNDLIVELEKTSGRDLTAWVQTWLQTAGVNTLRPQITVAGDTYSEIIIQQEVPTIPAGSKELRPHRLAVGLYDLTDGKLARRKSVELDVAGSATAVKELADEKIADLLLLNDHDITYAKIRLDERSIATLSKHLGDIVDPLSRALVWSSLWDSLRDGELAAHVYVPTALRALRSEAEIAVIMTTLLQLDTAVEMFACDKNRDALRTEVATAIEEMMNAAASGSDAQLQFARGFASAASTPVQGARIKELLEGKLAGLKIDADLRWHLIGCLVERGLMAKSDVDAELARDNTAHGQRAAAYAIAALPTAQAKAEAFAIGVEGKVSNTIHAATIRGFQRPSHRELLAAYVDPYFAKVVDIWEKQPFELAKTTATLLYPSWVITQETVTKSESWLNGAGKNAPAPLRRSVAEGRDGVARALKAQIKDGE